MPLRSYKATSPGRRWMTRPTFEEITTDKPHKPLLEPKKRGSGRNNQGRLTVRHRGGGEKTHYRRIDFKRDKPGVPARLATIEYDPNRSARIGLLHYRDGEKRYMLAAQRPQGRATSSSPGPTPRRGSATPCRSRTSRSARRSTTSSSCPGKGGQIVRSAGASAQLLAKEGDYAQIRLPVGRGAPRRACAAWRPSARSATSTTRTRTSARPAAPATWASGPRSAASAMTPRDHPHGGGEGKSPHGHAAQDAVGQARHGLPDAARQGERAASSSAAGIASS